MKFIYLLAAFVSVATLASVAYADPSTIVCISGMSNPDGSIAGVSGNFVQVTVLQNGAAAAYSLKDEFSLYDTHYNMKTPFDMSLVKPVGAAGTYQITGTAVSAVWTMSDDGTQNIVATLTADLGTGLGHLSTETKNDASGSFAGSTEDGLTCTTAGIR